MAYPILADDLYQRPVGATLFEVSNSGSIQASEADLALLLVREAFQLINAGYQELVHTMRSDPDLERLAKADPEQLFSSQFVNGFRKAKRELVSDGEKRAGALIRRMLSEARPSDGYRGEETGELSGTTGVWWLDDPVDGTAAMVKTAFAEAFGLKLPDPRPKFAITIGRIENGVATLGVVAELQPAKADTGLEIINLWLGQSTAGRYVTTLNGRSVARVSESETSCRAIVTTAPDVMFLDNEGRRDYVKEGGFEALLAVTGQPAPIIDGNIIGILDTRTKVAYERDLTSEDIAAAGPILEGLGLVIVDTSGQPLVFDDLAREYVIVAGNRSAVERAIAAIQAGEAEATQVAGEPQDVRPHHRYFDDLFASNNATGHTQKFVQKI